MLLLVTCAYQYLALIGDSPHRRRVPIETIFSRRLVLFGETSFLSVLPPLHQGRLSFDDIISLSVTPPSLQGRLSFKMPPPFW